MLSILKYLLKLASDDAGRRLDATVGVWLKVASQACNWLMRGSDAVFKGIDYPIDVFDG